MYYCTYGYLLVANIYINENEILTIFWLENLQKKLRLYSSSNNIILKFDKNIQPLIYKNIIHVITLLFEFSLIFFLVCHLCTHCTTISSETNNLALHTKISLPLI